ncbi:hypothetical protein ACH79_26410 [Bradyrhizobium sp. CCBAU 051011]|uniref:ChaB family protein n=1 Tax=Bradyrhizobium sp. CCBAU 051011 TaxID=858422 RepID=UPI00137458B3|nr:hypothetical protein ACH79_26410 [Bradyrhizobium sp. CCBAU 051011]
MLRWKTHAVRTNIDLPASVRDHVPPHAQNIYRASFNHASAAHAGDVRQEEIAHRTAWAAVKRSYVKDRDRWAPIEYEWPSTLIQWIEADRLAGKRFRIATTS